MNKVKADLNVAIAPVQRSGRRKKTGFLENKDQYLVWILAPYLVTEDPNLKFYYDYTQSIAEYNKVFGEVGVSGNGRTLLLTTSSVLSCGLKITLPPRKPSLSTCVMVMRRMRCRVFR
jgi:hypothetical protein